MWEAGAVTHQEQLLPVSHFYSTPFVFLKDKFKAALGVMLIHTVAQMCNMLVDAFIVLTDVKLNKA